MIYIIHTFGILPKKWQVLLAGPDTEILNHFSRRMQAPYPLIFFIVTLPVMV
jgi:hypothetical protein